MKLITEEISNVKIITEKVLVKNYILKEYFFKETLKTAMVECILWKLLPKRLVDIMKLLCIKVVLLGELGHPDGPTVNLDRVSHKITSLTEDGNNFKGKAQFLNTPMGKIASSLLDEGVNSEFLLVVLDH